MADLLSYLGKRVKGAIAEVNPFDGGATYNSVVNAPAPRPQVQQPQAPRPGSLPVGRASGPQNLSVARPKPPTLAAPVARPRVPVTAPPAPTNPIVDGIKAVGDFTGGINKAAVDTVTNVGKGLVGTAQRSANTLGQAGVGVVGALDTAGSLVQGDQAAAAKKNRHYTQMLDDIGTGTAIDGGKTSYISKDIMQGKASPVEFGKAYVDAGTEASSLIPMGGAVKGVVQSGTKLTGKELAGIAANNAKQAAVFGTATTANDALQGRKIDAGTLAMNYGAPLVLGAGSETLGRVVGSGTREAGKGTLRAAVEANRKIEQTNPKVKELDDALVNNQRAFDVETDPTRRAQINQGIAQLNQERRMLTQGGYVGNRPAMDIVPAERPVAAPVDKVAPTVKAKIEELHQQEALKPTTKEAGRYVQSNDFVPENASGSLVRKAQMINKQADEAIKSQVRLETQANMSNGIPMAQARKMAEEKVLARDDLAQMQQNRTAALAKAIEEDSVKQIDVKTPRGNAVEEFIAAPSMDEGGKASYELIPLDKEKHTLRNGSVVDKNGRSVGSYVGIDKEGNQFAYVEGKPVNINKIVGDVDKWGNLNNAFVDMDRLIEANAPDKATARKVQEFTTVFKDQQEARMKTEIATRRKDLSEVEAAITSDIPNGLSKQELSKDMFRMMESKVDMNEMRQKYGAGYIDKEVIPVLNWARTTFDEMLDNTNRVLERNGFDPIPRRDNYITHIQEDPKFWEKFGIGIQDLNPFGSSVSSDANPGKLRGGIPDAIVGNTDNTNARRRFNPFAQTRKGDQMQQDFFAAMDAYVEPMAFNEFMTPAASRARIVERTFRTYEKAKEIKFDQLAEIVGLDEARKLTPTRIPHKNYDSSRRSPLILAWQEYGNMLAGKTNKLDRKIMELGEGSSKAMDVAVKAQGIVGANSIPGSTTAALAQVLSLPQTIARDSATSTLKAARDMLNFADRGNKTDPLMQSSFMRARYTDATSRRKTTMQKYLSAASKPMEMIEREMGEISWRSAYHEAIKKGKTGQDAVRTADIETKKTLAGRGIGDRPVAMNSKALGVVTQFGLEVNNLRVQFWKDFTPQQKVKFMVAAAALNTIYGGMTGQTPLPDFARAALDTYGDMTNSTDDSKDDLSANLTQGAQRVFGESSKFVPGAPTIAGALMSDKDREQAFGKNGDLSRFGTPAAARVADATKDAVVGAVTGDLSKVRDAALSVVPTGAQIKRTVQGAETVNQGYVTNAKGNVQNTVNQEDPLGVAQGLTFGKYALPGQQSVMNRNSSLSDKQSERFKQLYKTDKKAAKDYFDSIMKRKADNPRAGTLTDVGSDSASAASPDSSLSVAQLIEQKATRSENLKNSMSPEDQDIMSLTKAERAKLVKDGTLTQEKVDGLENYYNNKRTELGYDDKAAKETYKDKYNTEKALFEKEKDSLSAVERAKRSKGLKYLSVKKDYENDTVDLYGMSKQDVYDLVSNDEQSGNKMVEDILKYGDALVAAGLEKKNKFRDKNGNVVLNDGKATGSGGKGGKKKSASTKSLVDLTSSLNKIRTPKTTGTKSASSDSIAPPQMKRVALKKFAVKEPASSTKKPVIKTRKA